MRQLADDEDGARSMLDQLPRDAAQEESSHRAQALGSTDHQITFELFGGLDDLVSGVAKFRELTNRVPRCGQAFGIAGEERRSSGFQLGIPEKRHHMYHRDLDLRCFGCSNIAQQKVQGLSRWS